MKKFFSASIIWLLSIIAILVMQLIGAVVLLSTPSEYHMVIQYVIMAVIQVLNVLIVFGVRKKRNFVSPYTAKKLNLSTAIKSVAVGLLTFVGMYLISQYVFVFLSNLGVQTGQLDISGGYLILAILTTVVLAPIGEEAIFRCSLTYGLNVKNTSVAVVLSALAFALMHMSPMQTFYQFFLGVALAALIVRSKNVAYTVIAHAVSNLAVILLSLVSLPEIPLFHPLTVVMAFVLLILCFLLVFIILKSIRVKESEIEEEKEEEQKIKEEKIFGILAFSVGAFICLIMWVAAFF